MSKARILAVDDQRYFRELVEGLLSDEGFEVHTASSGEEALHVLEREDFDIVVTDLVMPGIDGSELIRRIKERLPEQDVVMVTGVVDVKSAVDAMKQGATDYIIKPFDRPVLIEAIEKILHRRRLRAEHARLMAENLEYMGVVSLLERGIGLFSTLAVEPLSERIVDGLCLETRAQTGALWVAEEPGSETLSLVGARGLLRVEDEPEQLLASEIDSEWLSEPGSIRSEIGPTRPGVADDLALFVPMREGGELVGLVRLSDKLDGAAFSENDRLLSERFCQLGATAVANALRFRTLERRSLRDPETRAYSLAYFEDSVRNEIHKANRFGHRFSLMRIDLADLEGPKAAASADPEGAREALLEVVRDLEMALRSTDLLAMGEGDTYYVLMPETDALGAGILAQRVRQIRSAEGNGEAPLATRLAAATFPTDGTQLDSLLQTLEDRMVVGRSSLLATRRDLAEAPHLDGLLDRLFELGHAAPVEVEGQILRFLLEDIARRPADRGALFVSPGSRWLPDVIETLAEIRGRETRTEIFVLADGEAVEPSAGVTWVGKSGLDPQRPFAVYFGDGPAFALVGQGADVGERTAVFQSGDRVLVEYLAFELQRELEVGFTV